MNNQEAKFILGAYRPNGSDANDAAFAEALAQVDRDPELRQWLARQRAFDAAVTARLQDIAPPSDLKDAILAGARASRPRQSWWVSPGWLAAAAAIVVIATFGSWLLSSRNGPQVSAFAALALADLSTAHGEHEGFPVPLAGVQARLASARLPLLTDAGIDLAELRRSRCRSLRLGGREVFEICFQRDGAWFHLYAASRADFGDISLPTAKALLASAGGNAFATWADQKNVYALVTEAGEAVLRRLI